LKEFCRFDHSAKLFKIVASGLVFFWLKI